MTDTTTVAREAIIRCLSQSSISSWSIVLSEQDAALVADEVLSLPEISVPLTEAGLRDAEHDQFPNDG